VKRSLPFVFALLALLFAVAALAPFFIDRESFRPQIEQGLSRVTGHQAIIEGRVTLALLPRPQLVAKNLHILNGPGGSAPDMATAHAVKLRFSLLSLLSGETVIDSISLEQPHFLVETLPSGVLNWDLDSATAKNTDHKTAKAASASPLGFDKIQLHGGDLTWLRPHGAPLTLSKLDANLLVESLDGPFAGTGLATLAGIPLVFDLTTGAFAADKATQFSLGLRLQHEDGEAHFGGMLSNINDGHMARGKLTATTHRLSDLLKDFGLDRAIPPAAKAPLELSGNFLINPHEVSLTGLEAKVGDILVNGAIVMGGEHRIDATFTSPHIDLDRWLLPVLQSSGKNKGRSHSPDPSEAADSPFAEAWDATNASLILKSDEVRLGGDSLRQVNAQATVEKGRMIIHQASAKLPGDSEISLNGHLQNAAHERSGAGILELQSNDLRGLMAWAGLSAQAIPADRLRHFTLSSTWEIAQSTLPDEAQVPGKGGKSAPRAKPSCPLWSAPVLSLPKLDAALDDSRLRGAATIKFADRIALGIDANVDALDLDSYLPIPPPAPPKVASGKQSAARIAKKKAEEWAVAFPTLGTFDANLKLLVQRITGGRTAVQDTRIEATLLNGDLTLHDIFLSDLEGANVQMQGQIRNLGQAPQIQTLTIDAQTHEPARLATLFGLAPSFDLNRLGQTSLHAKISGGFNVMGFDRIDVEGRGEAGGAVANYQGSIVGLPIAPRFDADLSLTHDNLDEFIAVFLPDYHPAAPLGKLDITGRLALTADEISLAEVHGSIGPVASAGSVTLNLDGDSPTWEVALTTEDLPLDLFLPSDLWVAPPAPAPAPHDKAQKSHSKKKTASKPHSGKTVPPAKSVKVTVAPPHPTGPWSNMPLPLDWLKSGSLDLNIDAHSANWNGFSLAQCAASLHLSNGVLRLDKLTGKLYDGDFHASAALDSNSATPPHLSAQAAFTAVKAKDLLHQTGNEIAAGHLDGSWSLESQGGSIEEWINHLSGSGTLALHNGTLNGFDLAEVNRRAATPAALPDLLALVQTGLNGGQTKFSSLSGDFTAQEGVIQSENLALEAEGGAASGSLALSLPRYRIDGKFGITLADAPDMPAFGLRIDGPLNAPRKTLDVNDLQQYFQAKGMGKGPKSKSNEGLLNLPGLGSEVSETRNIVEEFLKSLKH